MIVLFPLNPRSSPSRVYLILGRGRISQPIKEHLNLPFIRKIQISIFECMKKCRFVLLLNLYKFLFGSDYSESSLELQFPAAISCLCFIIHEANAFCEQDMTHSQMVSSFDLIFKKTFLVTQVAVFCLFVWVLQI